MDAYKIDGYFMRVVSQKSRIRENLACNDFWILTVEVNYIKSL